VPDFDALYDAHADPWRVGSSWYEQRKLAVLLASLPRALYATTWEPGCGPGITTAALAERTEELVATDSSQAAVDLARERCRELDGVRVEVSRLPEVPVTPPVELIVAAEFLYYVEDLQPALDALWSVAAPGSHVVFLHWAHQPDDAFRSGPDMHAQIAIDAIDREALRVITHSDTDFMLDVYEATT
jgi:trans-aconitate methyltransferase